MNMKSEIKKIAYKKIKMNQKYRFFNSNYGFDDNVIPFLKHNTIIERIKNRVLFTNGGAFLITGLRGVGKSTLVKKALNELNEEKLVCLSVYINLSKKIAYKDLLFEIIRRLYETIVDTKLISKIDSQIANEIVLAYSRTSMSISNKNMYSYETEMSAKNVSLLGSILANNKLTEQNAEEASFLAYSENDVEHDLMRIVELLCKEKSINAKVVFVFDELDKLTITDQGITYFEDVLGEMKSLLCSVNAISFFIGGLDLYQKWNDDVAKINSLYDSIFCWHQYVPCVWNTTEELFDLFLEKNDVYEKISQDFQMFCEEQFTNIIKPSFKAFLVYLNFKSKGIPRKIYSEFNNFITWNDHSPYFQLTELDIKEITAYHEIWDKIVTIFEEQLYRTVIEMDLTYITCFNLIEYFFSHPDDIFSSTQIQEVMLYDSSLTPININSLVIELLEKLEKQHIIQRVAEESYIVTDVTIKQEDNLSIKDKSILHEKFEEEKVEIISIKKDLEPDQIFETKLQQFESYEIVEFWSDYEVKDLVLKNKEMSIFYVKNRKTNIYYNAIIYSNKQNKKLENRNCLYRESKYGISSIYLLNTTDMLMDSYIKTSLREIYNGYLLSHLIEAKIHPQYATLIIEQLLKFIIEINRQGYFNVNIKASNIMINRYLNVKVLDIKNLMRKKSKGIPIAAVGYAAPELYTDSYDARSDIYSVGVLLWEVINHTCLNKVVFERHIDFQFLNKPKNCSDKLWKIIVKATQFEPGKRYQTAEEFLEDIRKCKEYRVNKIGVRKDVSYGTVTNRYTYNDKRIFGIDRSESANDETILLNANKGYTEILGEHTVIEQKPYLIRVSTNEMIPVDKKVFQIGKDRDKVDYCIFDNINISRIHAGIISRENEYYLIDYGALNHTWLKEEMLLPNKEVKLEDGYPIKLANEEFVFIK